MGREQGRVHADTMKPMVGQMRSYPSGIPDRMLFEGGTANVPLHLSPCMHESRQATEAPNPRPCDGTLDLTGMRQALAIEVDPPKKAPTQRHGST